MVEAFIIKVLADENGNLLQPIHIGIEKITELGIYKVYGKRWWILKADSVLQSQLAEWCECNPKDRILCRAMECGFCHKCNKPIPPHIEYCVCLNKDSDGKGSCINCGKKIDFTTQPHPKPGEIEELKFGPGMHYSSSQIAVVDKLNELIRQVNGGGRE